MSIETYKDYFHKKAVLHKVLQHNPASDSDDGPIGGKRFTLFSQEDVLTSLRTEIPESPVLHLHLYELHLRDNEAGDKRGQYTGAFMITQAAGVNNMDEQVAAWAQCEEIAEDLLATIEYDERTLGPCSFPLGFIDWNTLDVSMVGPLWNGRFGCYVQFRYQLRRQPVTLSRVEAAFNSEGRIFEREFETQFE